MPADDMLTAIRNLADSLPSRVPSTLRVGEAVREVLRLNAAVAARVADVGVRLGVSVILDDSYQPWEWRLFDQWDEELHSGLIGSEADCG